MTPTFSPAVAPPLRVRGLGLGVPQNFPHPELGRDLAGYPLVDGDEAVAVPEHPPPGGPADGVEAAVVHRVLVQRGERLLIRPGDLAEYLGVPVKPLLSPAQLSHGQGPALHLSPKP